MLNPEEENEAEVRREDQENINKFGRLNARLHECREEVALLKVSKIILLSMDTYKVKYERFCSNFEILGNFCDRHLYHTTLL